MGLLHVNDYMYNVEGKCNVWKSVGEVQDLPYNETEIVLKKKAVRYAVSCACSKIGPAPADRPRSLACSNKTSHEREN